MPKGRSAVARHRIKPSPNLPVLLPIGATSVIEIISVDLQVDRIIPGQDFGVSFSTSTYSIVPIDVGSIVTANFYLIDSAGQYLVLDATGNPTALHTVALPNISITPDPFTSGKIIFEPVGAQQNLAWTIDGGYRLRLVLTGNGKHPGPFSSPDVPTNVVFETIDDSWWSWGNPSFRQVQWKVDDYSLSGVFLNQSKFSSFTINTAVLQEENESDQHPPDAVYAADQGNVTVSKGGNTQHITFSGKHFAKTFEWYIDGIFKPEPVNLTK